LQLFRAGQTDFLNVLTAEHTLYTDDSALTQSRENIAADLIALYKALGGGWDVGK
jgi:outer membrane protein TolC